MSISNFSAVVTKYPWSVFFAEDSQEHVLKIK